jgi:hypothetical protein
MNAHLTRRLSAISQEMARLRTEVSILREQLAFQADVMDEARVRSLVAETPLADREFRLAEGDHRRIDRAILDAERTLSELAVEQDRLLDALSPVTAG